MTLNNIPDVAEAFDGVRYKLELVVTGVESDLDELLLPVDGSLVSRLQLQTAALAPVQLHVLRHGECPHHQGRLGGHHLSPLVPLHPAQQPGVVCGVAVPGTPHQGVDGSQHLLAGGAPHVLLLVPPDLQQTGLETLLCQGGHEVAVDVVRDLLQDIKLSLIPLLTLSPVLGPVYPLLVRQEPLLYLARLVIVLVSPNIGVVVLLLNLNIRS